MSITGRTRTSGLRGRAAKWEGANFTRGHLSYREHLENLRGLLGDLAFVLDRDTEQAARWLREHGKKSRTCPKLPWLAGLTASMRYRYKGNLAAEAVLEAAKDAIRMAGVHDEYLLMEQTKPGDDRYRTEG